MTKKKNIGLICQLLLFMVAIIWGSSFVVLKNTLDSITPLWIMGLRFLISALVLGLFAGKRLFKLSRESYRGGGLLGLCVICAYLFQTYGLSFTTPGKNAFLTATYCVLTPLLTWLIYKKKPGKAVMPAALLCLAGIGFVSLNGGEGEAAFNLGDWLTLGCGVFFALQIVFLEKYREDVDAFSLNAMQFGIAGVFCTVLALIFEPIPTNIPLSVWLAIGYMSLVVTALCFFLQAWTLKYVSGAIGSLIMSLESVFGVLISVIFYDEKLTVMLCIGFALIFAAVVLCELGGDRRTDSHVGGEAASSE